MTDLLELAARVEAADTGSFDLDREIALATSLFVLERRGKDRQDWFYSTDPTVRRRNSSPYVPSADRLPRYSASLDAAMQLVPEGWDGQVQFGSRPGAWVGAPDRIEADDFNAAATPALALCAAALRARATGAPQ